MLLNSPDSLEDEGDSTYSGLHSTYLMFSLMSAYT